MPSYHWNIGALARNSGTRNFGLLLMSVLGFKARVDPLAGADPLFPEGGGANHPGWGANLQLCQNLSKKLHEIENILGHGGALHPPLLSCVLHHLNARFLRFTSGVTPVNLLMAIMATKPFNPHTCTHVDLYKHWWDSNPAPVSRH